MATDAAAIFAELQATAVGDAAGILATIATLIDPTALDATTPEALVLWAAALQELMAQSVDRGVEFIASNREELGVDPRVSPVRRPTLPELEAIAAGFSWLAPAVKRRIAVGMAPQAAIDEVVDRAAGVATVWVQGPARATVQASADYSYYMGRSEGWRVTPGSGRVPCAFCALRISRGNVYRTENRAMYAWHGDKYHLHCYCQPVEAFTEWEPEGQLERISARAYEHVTRGGGLEEYLASKGREGEDGTLNDTLNAMRHYMTKAGFPPSQKL